MRARAGRSVLPAHSAGSFWSEYIDEVAVLKCVKCGRTGLERESVGWTCAACGATFPLIGGVGRFVASEHYTGSFGYQWNAFAQSQLDSANGTSRSRDTFVEKTGLPIESLRGKRVLDAGCGMGRFAEVCIQAGADVHAIDLSTAVEAAARNLGHHPNVSFYQADIMNLPFHDGTFDIVYSIGVLHHTPDTKRAFLSLSRLVKPGGLIVIWVYATIPHYVIGGELLRLVTPRLPKPLLLKMSKVAIPLYHVHRLPVVGRVSSALLPTSVNPDPEWRWLDTFDWYSPRYQWKHTYDEVEGWFREAGLIDIAREPFPVAVRGARAGA
jgi:2-polyprenyl-3-methyl-5-hydroxy-6-metoxy-1,4-benzoquinol methylase